MKSETMSGLTDTYSRNAIIVGCIIAVLVTGYFINETEKEEDYISIYILPDSYSNYIDGENIQFTYGIKQYGKRSSKYILRVYLGEQMVTERDLKTSIGMNEVIINVPKNIMFPTKVQIELETDNGINDVHFWVYGRKEGNSTKT